MGLGFQQLGDFLGQIDPDWAPGDAATATDTAAGIELVVPGSQFVGQPLTVARADGVSCWGTGGVGKVGVEARVPAAMSDDRFVDKVVDFVDT